MWQAVQDIMNVVAKNEIKKGSMIFIPADAEHDIINESDEVLRLF